MNDDETDYLRLSPRGFLATVSPTGRPTVVPVCFVYDKGRIYTAVDRKPKRTTKLSRLANIAGNARVAFIVDNYSENWDSLSYLLIHGQASILKVGEEVERARRLLLQKYPQYRRLRLDSSEVIAISVEESKLWSFSDRISDRAS